MHIGQGNDRLTLRYYSEVWIILFVLVLITLGVLLTIYIGIYRQCNINYDLICNILSAMIGLGLIILCIIIIIILRPAIYIIDHTAGELTIFHRRLFGKQVERYPISYINAVELYTFISPTAATQDSSWPYYLVILLMHGKGTNGRLKAKQLIISGTLGKKRSQARADMVASFLNLVVHEKTTGA
jgi:hypothetical protein